VSAPGPYDRSWSYQSNPQSSYADPYGPKPHSMLGIVSFVMAMLIGLADLLLFGGIMIVAADNPRAAEPPRAAIMMALLLLGSVLPAIVGAVLGLVGVMDRQKNHLWAWLGLAFNGIFVLGLGGCCMLSAFVGMARVR